MKVQTQISQALQGRNTWVGLAGLRKFQVTPAWACARGARSSPGFHIMGFQPWWCLTDSLSKK